MIKTVAILGAGIGTEHAAAYARLPQHFNVTSICDQDTNRGAVLAKQVGARHVVDAAAVLSDPSIDIIDICLPPSLHVSVALEALRFEKHVIVEKPLAGSVLDADRLTKAEQKSSGRIFPVFNYRYGRAMAALERLRAEGFLSRPLVAALETHWNRDRTYYDNPWRGDWDRELGGAVLSHAIHIHDLLSYVFGQVASVSATLATRVNPIETEDCAAIAFRMASGAVASSSITLGAADNRSRLRLIYEDISVESGLTPYTPVTENWVFQARNSAKQAKIDKIVASVEAPQEGFCGLFLAIAENLNGLEDTGAPLLAEGVSSIELAAAIYQSDRSGSHISLPLDRALPICADFRP